MQRQVKHICLPDATMLNIGANEPCIQILD